MKTNTVTYKLAAAVILVVPVAFMVHRHLTTVARDNRLLEDMVWGWQAAGPHTTVTGRLRAHLAAAWWLGPLQLATPRDPLLECGRPFVGGWRGACPKTHQTLPVARPTIARSSQE